MAHARPVYRPGPRRRAGHVRDMAALLLRTGLVLHGSPLRAPAHVGEMRRWGTSLGGIVVGAAAREPHRTALADDAGTLTFAELDARTTRLAAALPVNGPRPRVGVLCRNHRGMAETLVACSKRGVEVVLLNTGFGGARLREVLGEMRPDLLVADPEFAPLLAQAPIALRRAVVWTGNPSMADAVTLDGLVRATPEETRLDPPSVQSRTVMLSSGTTGRPKGARRPPRPGLWPLASMTSRIPLRSRQTMVIEAPLFHAWGYAALQMAWGLRAPVVLHRRFDPEQTLRAVAAAREAAVFAVPVMAQRILDLPGDLHDVSGLRVLALSGGTLPGDLAARLLDAFGDVVYNVYGSTEASWISIATPRDLRTDPRTAGRPPRNTTLAILDGQGRPVGRSTIGHIHAANEMLFEGYTGGEPMEVRDGLLATGDLGHIDHRGLLFVDGRRDGMIVSGGENVLPREIEDVILGLPGVREVAVVAVPDPEWGQRPAAFVVLYPGAALDVEKIRDHVGQVLSRPSVPRDVRFLPDLPRNATGKVVTSHLLSPPAAGGR